MMFVKNDVINIHTRENYNPPTSLFFTKIIDSSFPRSGFSIKDVNWPKPILFSTDTFNKNVF